ncbi:MAG: 3-dehydroquinate synthase [Oscillospiraceae bacterium]|nr:3-dehydroquinate synthase [Oscillospiraceae bacterium]MDD4413114.1 3-dehydroquinate synthase [Oscillospiraceae bacterium]
MTQITVKTACPYDILVGSGLLERSGELARQVNSGHRALIVTDSNVAPLYSERVAASFIRAGFETEIFMFPAGEQSKRLDTISEIYTHLAKANFTREDLLVALGGGVTGDMTGFAAATWLRGIDFIQLPTTLLAQVDSSVGGKTGVDISQGKNLVGAFRQPVRVVADIGVLDTLPDAVFTDGMAEVIKTAAIMDASLFEILLDDEAMSPGSRQNIISRCIDIKRQIVERDEYEAGERKLLNFGHTLGHALEKHYNYSGITHGSAVAIGMLKITAASEKQGLTALGTAKRLELMLKRWGLPVDDNACLEDYLSGIRLDKKRAGANIDLVLLRDIGHAFIHTLPVDDLAVFLDEAGEANA